MDSQTWKYSHLGKEKWGGGEWHHEPDKAQWMDEETGMPCMAIRVANFGHWCGYVGVSEGHPLYEQDYTNEIVSGLEVHGGVTFADSNTSFLAFEAQQGSLWVFGFDCAHMGDYSPSFPWTRGGTYRNLIYVKNECAALAQQLAALVKEQQA